MARTQCIGIRHQLTSLISSRRLEALARETGALKRSRKVRIVPLFWTLVLGFGAGKERTFAGLRRLYAAVARQRLVPSAFWDRFTPDLARFLKRVAQEVMAKVGDAQRTLHGSLGGFRDLVVADATVLRLHELLARAFPGSRTNHTKAACKLHVVMSVLAAGPRTVKITSERAHDGKTIRIGPWIRDRLLLIDLGYYAFGLFERIRRNGGHFISRLKCNANPKIVGLHGAEDRGGAIIGKGLQETLGRLRRKVLDAEVEVTYKRRSYAGERTQVRTRFRLVAIWDTRSRQYHTYITNIPPARLSAEEVATTYRARWLAELLFAEWKSGYGIGDIPSRKRSAVEVFVYTSVITLLASRRLLVAVRKKLQHLAHRIPAMRWVRVFRAYVMPILLVLLAPPRHGRYFANAVEAGLLHEALDPHLSRPGLLEQVQNATTGHLAKA